MFHLPFLLTDFVIGYIILLFAFIMTVNQRQQCRSCGPLETAPINGAGPTLSFSSSISNKNVSKDSSYGCLQSTEEGEHDRSICQSMCVGKAHGFLCHMNHNAVLDLLVQLNIPSPVAAVSAAWTFTKQGQTAQYAGWQSLQTAMFLRTCRHCLM